MTRTIDISVTSNHPDVKIDTLYVFAGSPFAPRLVNVPEKIGSWEIEDVNVSALYPDNTTATSDAVKADDKYVATLPGCATSGTVEMGFEVSCDGTDENGEPFEGLVLGCGDLVVIPKTGTAHDGGQAFFFRLLDDIPEHPNIGDVANFSSDGQYLQYYTLGGWRRFGGGADFTLDDTLSVSGAAAEATSVRDALEFKRDLDDMSVYDDARWVYDYTGHELEENVTGPEFRHDDSSQYWYFSPGGGDFISYESKDAKIIHLFDPLDEQQVTMYTLRRLPPVKTEDTIASKSYVDQKIAEALQQLNGSN